MKKVLFSIAMLMVCSSAFAARPGQNGSGTLNQGGGYNGGGVQHLLGNIGGQTQNMIGANGAGQRHLLGNISGRTQNLIGQGGIQHLLGAGLAQAIEINEFHTMGMNKDANDLSVNESVLVVCAPSDKKPKVSKAGIFTVTSYENASTGYVTYLYKAANAGTATIILSSGAKYKFAVEGAVMDAQNGIVGNWTQESDINSGYVGGNGTYAPGNMTGNGNTNTPGFDGGNSGTYTPGFVR